MELRANSQGEMVKSFAGDTYNTAVYAKRFNPQLTLQYLTGLGEDHFSQEMLTAGENHGLDFSLSMPVNKAAIGIYAISTDDAGERSFTYWRKNSAATYLMKTVNVSLLLDKCQSLKYVYFSGISLAIMDEEDKRTLLELIVQLKHLGAEIVFDPNYRPSMWNDVTHTQHWLTQCYKLADIVLPGLDEHKTLFGHQTKNEIVSYFKNFAVKELVIKCDNDGVFCITADGEYHVPFTPAAQQVDSTAAGDSFAGTYIAARATGRSVKQSLIDATDVARVVVQHPGAIISNEAYTFQLNQALT